MRALVRALLCGSCRELEYLGLGMNEVGDEGAAALAHVLRRRALPTLRCLALWASGISEVGAWSLVRAVEETGRGRLEDVDFGGAVNEGGLSGVVKEAMRRAIHGRVRA